MDASDIFEGILPRHKTARASAYLRREAFKSLHPYIDAATSTRNDTTYITALKALSLAYTKSVADEAFSRSRYKPPQDITDMKAKTRDMHMNSLLRAAVVASLPRLPAAIEESQSDRRQDVSRFVVEVHISLPPNRGDMTCFIDSSLACLYLGTTRFMHYYCRTSAWDWRQSATSAWPAIFLTRSPLHVGLAPIARFIEKDTMWRGFFFELGNLIRGSRHSNPPEAGPSPALNFSGSADSRVYARIVDMRNALVSALGLRRGAYEDPGQTFASMATLFGNVSPLLGYMMPAFADDATRGGIRFQPVFESRVDGLQPFGRGGVPGELGALYAFCNKAFADVNWNVCVSMGMGLFAVEIVEIFDAAGLYDPSVSASKRVARTHGGRVPEHFQLSTRAIDALEAGYDDDGGGGGIATFAGGKWNYRIFGGIIQHSAGHYTAFFRLSTQRPKGTPSSSSSPSPGSPLRRHVEVASRWVAYNDTEPPAHRIQDLGDYARATPAHRVRLMFVEVFKAS